MAISRVSTQLRTTDLEGSVRFYTTQLGMELAFRYQDFYAGIRVGHQLIHLKLVNTPDPSVIEVREGGHFHLYVETDDVEALAAQFKQRGVALIKDVHATAWGTHEFVLEDDQGHTVYVGQRDAP